MEKKVADLSANLFANMFLSLNSVGRRTGSAIKKSYWAFLPSYKKQGGLLPALDGLFNKPMTAAKGQQKGGLYDL